MKIVLDKSFIQGCPRVDFHSFLRNYECYLPESVFFELLTTTQEKRISSFSKLIEISSPVKLVQNVGAFLQYESANNKPCFPDYVLVTNKDFEFNKGLIKSEFQISESQLISLKEWQTDISSEVDEFMGITKCLPQLFPEIGNFRPGQCTRILDQIEIDLAEEDFLFELYENLTTEKYPRRPLINISWATIRWVQIKISAAIKFIKAYGINSNLEANKKTIENLFLDFHHLLPAVQCDGIATKDIWIKETIKRIRKDAIILP